jgi:hypothetical protein
LCQEIWSQISTTTSWEKKGLKSIPGRVHNFLSSKSSKPVRGSTQPLVERVQSGGGVKRLGHEPLASKHP